jgi:hypothetical protein
METSVMDKCLAFCQALVVSNQKFAFSLTIGKDTVFNFNNKELVTSSCKKKKSPSQVRREAKRRNDREARQAAEATEKVTGSAGAGFNCDQCNYKNVSEKGLKQHKRMKHKPVLETPEKERHTSKQGDISLSLSPGEGLREEKCVNCDVTITLDHQCDEAHETPAAPKKPLWRCKDCYYYWAHSVAKCPNIGTTCPSEHRKKALQKNVEVQ